MLFPLCPVTNCVYLSLPDQDDVQRAAMVPDQVQYYFQLAQQAAVNQNQTGGSSTATGTGGGGGVQQIQIQGVQGTRSRYRGYKVLDPDTRGTRY